MAIPKTENKANAQDGRINSFWWIALVQGVAAVLFGLVALFWPSLTLVALVYLFSAFILAWGIVEIVHGFVSIGQRGSWWLSLLFGIAGLVAGMYLVRHPGVSFTAFVLIIGLFLIGRGVLDLVSVFLDKGGAGHKLLLTLVGVAALIAGIFILFQPVTGGVTFVWALGLYALIFGALTIALALQSREHWPGHGSAGSLKRGHEGARG